MAEKEKHLISVTLYGMSEEDYNKIKEKYDGTAHPSHTKQGKFDVTIDLLETEDAEFADDVLKSGFVGVM